MWPMKIYKHGEHLSGPKVYTLYAWSGEYRFGDISTSVVVIVLFNKSDD